MKSIVLAVMIISCGIQGMAQEIKQGEKAPDAWLEPLINYEKTKTRISELKGKAVILDFWAITCGQCIADLPNLGNLQRKFGQQLQVILINNESKEATMQFFAKRKRIPFPTVPMLIGDSAWHKLFPHMYKPHQIWIDKDGTVKHITDGYGATEQNIKKFIAGEELDLVEKEYEEDYMVSNHLSLFADPKWQEAIESYSMITRPVSGMLFNSGIRKDDSGKVNFICANNNSVVQLLTVAYSENGKYDFLHSNTVILEIKDSFAFQRPSNRDRMAEWNKRHCFNYVLSLPPGNGIDAFVTMQDQLKNYFKVDATVESRKVKCLVLIRTGDIDLLATKSKESKTNFWRPTDDTVHYLYNKPFSMLVTRIKYMLSGKRLATPFIDTISYSGNIDIEINRDVFMYGDIQLLRTELQRYGLDIIEKDVEKDVLVIRSRE